MKTILLSLIYLFIVDVDTKEALTGVEVKNLTTNEIYYTDLEGKVELCGDNTCKYQLSYVSYSDTTITNIKADTTIELN